MSCSHAALLQPRDPAQAHGAAVYAGLVATYTDIRKHSSSKIKTETLQAKAAQAHTKRNKFLPPPTYDSCNVNALLARLPNIGKKREREVFTDLCAPLSTIEIGGDFFAVGSCTLHESDAAMLRQIARLEMLSPPPGRADLWQAAIVQFD